MILTIILGAALLTCLGLLLYQYGNKTTKTSDENTDEVKISRDLSVTISHRSDYIQDMHLATHFNVNLVNITREDCYIQDIKFRFNKIPINDVAYDEENQLLIIDDRKISSEIVSIPQGMKNDLKFSRFFKLYSNESIDFKYTLVCKALSSILKHFNIDEHTLTTYMFFIDVVVIMENGSIVKSNKIDLRKVVSNINRVATLDLHHSIDVFERLESDKPYVKPSTNNGLTPYQNEVENYLRLHIPPRVDDNNDNSTIDTDD